jgi:hypothetical protein
MKKQQKVSKLTLSKRTILRLSNIINTQINGGFIVQTSQNPDDPACNTQACPTGGRKTCFACVSEPACKTSLNC